MALKIKVNLVCKLGWCTSFYYFFFKCNIKAIALLWVFSKMLLKIQVGRTFVELQHWYLDKGCVQLFSWQDCILLR